MRGGDLIHGYDVGWARTPKLLLVIPLETFDGIAC
jgi:hypothetical protein